MKRCYFVTNLIYRPKIVLVQNNRWGGIGASSICCCDMYYFGCCRSTTFSCSCHSVQSKQSFDIKHIWEFSFHFSIYIVLMYWNNISGWTMFKIKNLSYTAKGSLFACVCLLTNSIIFQISSVFSARLFAVNGSLYLEFTRCIWREYWESLKLMHSLKN